jgi:eukaryotic-like serine/threonine-protein kinase
MSQIRDLHHKRLPQQFGAFLLDKALWRGAHSSVFYAMDLRDQAPVAVKILYPTADCGQECQRRNGLKEAARLRELKHPNIIELRQHGDVNGLSFLSFPYIDGKGLDQSQSVLANHQQALACMAKVSRALHLAHTKGIIHRDLKPRNILLNSSREPFVLDWGLSWRKGDFAEAGVQQIVGTPAYMSPEQARGSEEQLTPASDVYSLGAILYHLLTGKPPFDADTTWKTLQMSMSMPPQAPSRIGLNIDSRLDSVVMICLEKDPKNRYPSAEALAADIQRIHDDQTPKGKSGVLGRLLS